MLEHTNPICLSDYIVSRILGRDKDLPRDENMTKIYLGLDCAIKKIFHFRGISVISNYHVHYTDLPEIVAKD